MFEVIVSLWYVLAIIFVIVVFTQKLIPDVIQWIKDLM